MIATVLEKKGKYSHKWKVGELRAVVKHLKRPSNQKITFLQVDILARFEMTRHRLLTFLNVSMVDASNMKTPGSAKVV